MRYISQYRYYFIWLACVHISTRCLDQISLPKHKSTLSKMWGVLAVHNFQTEKCVFHEYPKRNKTQQCQYSRVENSLTETNFVPDCGWIEILVTLCETSLIHKDFLKPKFRPQPVRLCMLVYSTSFKFLNLPLFNVN